MFDEKNRVLIVRTHRNVFSFPKGKKEEYDTTIYECARREFLEETGMYGFVYLTDKIEIESKSKKPGKIIIYYVCKIEKRLSSFQNFLCDPDGDVLEANFYSIEEALQLENFEQERKDVLIQASEKLCKLNIYDSFLSLEQEARYSSMRNPKK